MPEFTIKLNSVKLALTALCLLPILGFGQFGFERDQSIHVIKNNIQQKFPWVGGLDFCQYSNIDLDLDGTLDLFIFDQTCDKTLTFLQKGAAGEIDFEYAPEYEASFEGFSNWTLLADYNNDGKMDIFTSKPSGAMVLKNVSTASTGLNFVEASSYLFTTIYGGISNLHINGDDIPAIVDVDGDNDLDVLAFYSNSGCVRYYKNLSQELYNHSDSLVFEAANVCWGNFVENDFDNGILFNTCCQYTQVDDPQFVIDDRPGNDNQDRHAGSTVLALDLDANTVMDLILGDVVSPNLVMLMNGGTAPNTNSAIVSQESNFPSYDVPANMAEYLGAYYVDVNNDNIRDLLVSPLNTITSQNIESNWLYINDGADNFPNFEFQEPNFLQGKMIDHGTGALPVFFDHNSDGLKDLLVSVSGQYDPISGNQITKMAYYENTGTANAPEFTFITDDYQNLSSQGSGANLYFYPTFGDLDGDGDDDLILGEYSGYLFLYENTGGAGNPAVYTSFVLVGDNQSDFINEGILSAPKIIDLNKDGLLDIVIGKRNGKLTYYENTGSLTTYNFQLKTQSLGDVDVSEYWTSEGVAVPEFIEIDSEYHLIVGAKNGYLHYYNNIDGNLNGSFDLVDSTLEDINIGKYAAPAIYDIDADNRFEMILGNKRGGVSLFKSVSISTIGFEDFIIDLDVYPNPVEDILTIDLSKSTLKAYKDARFVMRDISGRTILSENIKAAKTAINCKSFGRGVYTLTVYLDQEKITRKIILQ